MTAIIGFFIGFVCGCVIGGIAVLMLQVRQDREAKERARFEG